MTRQLTSRSRLETLRKEAKRWIQSIRAGDPQARARLHEAHPDAPQDPGLRDVQHALAREYGEQSWVALKDRLLEISIAHADAKSRVDEFLVEACIHYGVKPGTTNWDRHYTDSPMRWAYAARLLARHPSIASHDLYTAIVSGDIDEVKRLLAARPEAANESGGPAQWPPLFYVAYNRLPTEAARDNSLGITRALLAAGADPNVTISGDLRGFPPLTGVIGGGEMGQPPHSKALELADLLIEGGADPWNPQALYNTALGGHDMAWPDFLYERSARRNETNKWTAHANTWPETGILDWLLSHAVMSNSLMRAKWALERGANPATPHFYSKRNVHTEARLNGFNDMAALLIEHGASAETLSGHDAFQAAVLSGDRATASEITDKHPEYLQIATPLFKAAEANRVDAITMLLDLGMSPDVIGPHNTRALHRAAACDAVEAGKLLIERGAEIDPLETYQNGVPLGWSVYAGTGALAEILAPLSRHVPVLVNTGHIARLRELFEENPALAQQGPDNGAGDGSLLFLLPNDEMRAIEVAELLLEYGANRQARNAEGLTPAEYAEKLGFDILADVLVKP